MSIIIFIFFYFPHIYWKYYNWGGDIYQYILNPFPTHLPGFNNFESLSNKLQKRHTIDISFNTNEYGYIYKYNRCLSNIFTSLYQEIQFELRIKIILIILFYLAIVSIKGQITGRFLVEPIFWLIIILSKNEN